MKSWPPLNQIQTIGGRMEAILCKWKEEAITAGTMKIWDIFVIDENIAVFAHLHSLGCNPISNRT